MAGRLRAGMRRVEGFDVFVFLFLLAVGSVTLFPVLHVLSVSLSHPDEVVKGIGWLPRRLDVNAYRYLLSHEMIPTGYRNTVLYTVVGTSINLVMTAIAAYPLSKRRLFLRGVFTFFVVFTMYFSGGLIPLFLLVRRLGMYNTLWALVVPGAISVWNLVIMRTFFQSLPEELEESAFLDGAGVLRTLVAIVLPLSKAAFATIGLFYALGHWNSFFSALVYLKDADRYPLTLIVRDIVLGEILKYKNEELAFALSDLLQRGIDPIMYQESFRYATIFLSIVPMLAVYPFIQKYFVRGVMIGSLKG